MPAPQTSVAQATANAVRTLLSHLAPVCALSLSNMVGANAVAAVLTYSTVLRAPPANHCWQDVLFRQHVCLCFQVQAVAR